MSAETSPYQWIRTRDGSPTLWHNDLGESFRSLKGAFTESWAAFVEPALVWVSAHPSDTLVVGEFGLGPGTNWALWTIAAARKGFAHNYFVIERDLSSFELGRAKWIEEAPALAAFLNEKLGSIDADFVRRTLEAAPSPFVEASLEAAHAAHHRADVWFHDPFGYEVNPDGYSPATIELCSRLWKTPCWGGSYACNRTFRDSLAAARAGLDIRTVPTGGTGLKRERLEFSRD